MKAKYDTIGINYNETRSADPYITEQLLKKLKPKAFGLYLDIGCGTGNYTNEFNKHGYRFIGIDPSDEMLKKAKQKNKNIDWKLGKAENITLKTETLDGIIGSLTIHHWTDLGKSFTELYRVLKPKTNIVIFTSTPKQMKGYWLNHYFPKMLEDSMQQMPSLDTIEKTMTLAGFSEIKTEPYFIKPDLKDLFLYCGKQNPSLYLDAAIRHGISSFSSLANKDEVENGLEKLKKDIENNEINNIIQSYENNLGDYLFISGKK
ncbi:class I SAM-dependent methyltransferase [Algibacter marinivivus]|uniref:Class I SAM-dependent methyltransferase n=1 Tax=Algibacter marinivivus TaxID=2100723 RepID=A0A2U2X155_9FLAO|nr:class I SAM-dependent methyltransferase [Algibacter marinivivus]PWH81490.1 class I SAM-dependent methyltransferase [Algibacter marinivivus]